MVTLFQYKITQFLKQVQVMTEVLKHGQKMKTLPDISREIPRYPDPICRPPPKPIENPYKKILEIFMDFNPEIHKNFKENSPYQEGVISETYQRLGRNTFTCSCKKYRQDI